MSSTRPDSTTAVLSPAAAHEFLTSASDDEVLALPEWIQDRLFKLAKEHELMATVVALGTDPKGSITIDDVNQMMANLDALELPNGNTTPAVVVPTRPKEARTMKNKHMKSKQFRPTIGGVQLQPQTEKVRGLVIWPIYKHIIQDGRKVRVVDTIVAKNGDIEVAKASAFRNIPGIKFVTIASKDAGDKAACLQRYLRELTKNDVANGKTGDDIRIAVGNIKKEDCVMGVLPKRDWDAFFGCDVRALNLWKVILPIMTPTGIEIKPEYSNIQTMKFRVLDAQLTIGGYPENDGDIITKVWMEFWRHADIDHSTGLPKPNAKVKKINRNWQMRASGFDVAGKVMPAIKAKVYADDNEYMRKCERHGYAPETQDAFITKDNLKTLAWNYKHGDILEIPITNIRNVKTKMKSWSSSMGAQCVANSDMQRTREVLNGHGILDKAETIKHAAELELEAILKVLTADEDARWEDALGVPVKLMFSRYINGGWKAPRMFRDSLYSRLESYYKDNGIKVQIDKDGYYIQGCDTLDAKENALEAETGKLQYYCTLPKTAKFVGKIAIGDKIDLGRDPNVGPSNLMTFIVAGFNDSHDAILMSWQAIYSMYGDVDGDTIKYETLIANTSDRMFQCLRRPVPEAKTAKQFPAKLPTMEAYLNEHMSVGLSVLKSAADTGSLDLTTRQIIEERMYMGNPMTVLELMVLSQLRQDAIDGLKHTDAGVADDAKAEIVKTYGVNGKMAELKNAPLTYRLLRKDAGKPYLKDTGRFLERIKLINDAKPHADHPYHDFFVAMKGIKGIEKNSDINDSEWLFLQCNNLQKEIQANHAKGGVYAFNWASVNEMAVWMANNHKAESIKYLSYPEDERKEAFGLLKETHRSLINQKMVNMFTDAECPASIQYQRQLAVALGVKGFGRGTKPMLNDAGEETTQPYAKTGGAIWNVLEEATLYLAELINKRAVARGEFPCVNPHMEEIKAALQLNRQKAADKEAIKAAIALSQMD
jgi:hypothetical protein